MLILVSNRFVVRHDARADILQIANVWHPGTAGNQRLARKLVLPRDSAIGLR